MDSDMMYDVFGYNSSQNGDEIDYLIEQFEFRQCYKSRKINKQIFKKSPYPISFKFVKGQSSFIRTNCIKGTLPQKIKKPRRYDRYRPQCKVFEIDKHFNHKSMVPSDSISADELGDSVVDESNTITNVSKKLEEDFESFENFLRHFYRVYHKSMKSSLQNHPDAAITNIRLAPISLSLRNDFMRILNENKSHFPELVYHGTHGKNIASILQYGLLIPNQAHPWNNEAPIISIKHGQSYGAGIYSSHSISYSLAYANQINTVLVCAAIPKRDRCGKICRLHEPVLVLSHVSRIIPLFLFDFEYKYGLRRNYSYFGFNNEKQCRMHENGKVKEPSIISRKYLRKVVDCINTQDRNNNRYQVRSFQFFT